MNAGSLDEAEGVYGRLGVALRLVRERHTGLKAKNKDFESLMQLICKCVTFVALMPIGGL